MHEDDAALVARLVAAYPRATFDELVELRLAVAEDLPADLREAYTTYRRERLGRGRRLYAMFRARVRERYGEPGRGIALDLGCGVGASLLAMAGDFAQVVGVDPSLPDLILARKALEQAGIANVTLAQAYAQGVPLADGCCDWASAQNVLEHVMDLDGALREVGRVLRPGGAFAADSRNRYDLFMLEPHVRLRWVGCLPRRWQAAYVRARRGLAYTGTRLLSYGELLSALRRHVGLRTVITYPDVTAYGVGPGSARAVERVARVPLAGALLLRVFPSHLAVGVCGGAR
jgi:ubiquinone/menaquinone biosynthesis C-methylase UbiE